MVVAVSHVYLSTAGDGSGGSDDASMERESCVMSFAFGTFATVDALGACYTGSSVHEHAIDGHEVVITGG